LILLSGLLFLTTGEVYLLDVDEKLGESLKRNEYSNIYIKTYIFKHNGRKL